MLLTDFFEIFVTIPVLVIVCLLILGVIIWVFWLTIHHILSDLGLIFRRHPGPFSSRPIFLPPEPGKESRMTYVFDVKEEAKVIDRWVIKHPGCQGWVIMVEDRKTGWINFWEKQTYTKLEAERQLAILRAEEAAAGGTCSYSAVTLGEKLRYKINQTGYERRPDM